MLYFRFTLAHSYKPMADNKSENWITIFWHWLVKYSGNVFSIIGILLTIYFGAFYVPTALKEAEQEKLRNAQLNIVQSFKEIAYADSTFTVDDVHEIYDAEQIRINEPLPLSEKQILTATQGAFMADKFLPLQDRNAIYLFFF